ncbi:MAG: extracellular solute-binding protein, partial [Oscillospiraceae bacterium]|nr:extracellular solute-binding protein [Oscillospiraceae bacterium]
MYNFMVMLLECSAVMSALTLAYMLLNRLLAKRYSEKWWYYAWLIIIIGLIIPFRPNFGMENAAIQLEVPERLAMPVYEYVEREIPSAENSPLYEVNYVPNVFTETTLIETPAAVLPKTNILANISWWDVAAIVWLIGMAVFITYQIIHHRRFIKMTKRWGENVSDEETLELFRSLKTEMKINRRINLQICPFAVSPMLVGVVKPLIILPETDFNHNELRFILKHELVHYKRGDVWYRFLLMLATALHWFNPVVYLLEKSVAVSCELSCDDEVVKGTDLETRRYYSATILDVVRYQTKLKTRLSTYLNGGKKTMKKRLSSIMDTARKRAGVIIACVIVIAVLGTGLVLAIKINWPAISELMPDTQQPSINILELEDTDKLVIYGHNSFIDSILKPAVTYYKNMNRHVEVEYKLFELSESFNADNFRNMVRTELLAGEGPDVIIVDSFLPLFDDIYKTMDSGIFFDLTETINADTDFNMNLYNNTIIDSGIYKGKRYVMPIDYSVFTILTLQENLDAENIALSDLSTLEGFTGAIRKFMTNNMDIPNKYISSNYPSIYHMVTYFPYSNIKFVDYENRKVDLSDPNLKNLADLNKEIITFMNHPNREFYSYIDEISNARSGYTGSTDPVIGLRSGRVLYLDEMIRYGQIKYFYYDYGALINDRTPLVTIFSDTNGGTTAIVNNYAGIRQSSENKKNAYNFIKLLLSYDIQSLPVQNPYTYYQMSIPVLTAAARAYAKSELEKIGNGGATDDGSVIWEAIPKEVHDQYVDMLINVDSCVLPMGTPLGLLMQGLDPYFNGEKTYEA